VRRLALILAALLPASAWAEVMDKEFGLSIVVAAVLIAGLAAFAASRWLPWALLVVLPLTTLFFVAHLSELLDPHVGPAISREAGAFYVGISWISPFVVIVGVVLGLLLRRGSKNAAT
jgi:hypothetical protein